MVWRPRIAVRATDRGLAWSSLWICVSCATACYGSVILTIFLWYRHSWDLLYAALDAGESAPSRASMEHLSLEFMPMLTGFAAGWVCFTVAACVVFVALLRAPVCHGKRYAG